MISEKSKVAVIACDSYEKEAVRVAVGRGVTLLGGWEQFISKKERILLKPNLLAKVEPDKACTTHPAVFGAVGASLREEGYETLCYGDSSGNHLLGLAKIAETCGILPEVKSLGIEEADFSAGKKVSFEEGRTCREFILCNGVLEADGIINICKMKTHMLERVTGAVKNTFGCVYGFNKGAAHAKFSTADSFGRMLADLNCLVKPRLHIMDGIMAMEGNGPQSGTPVSMGLILLSADPVALDSVFCHLVDLKPELVPTNVYGQEYGVGTFEADGIAVLTGDGEILSVGEAAARWGNPDFDVNRGGEIHRKVKLLQMLNPILERKPIIDKAKCISCGICVNSCPLDDKAVYFYKEPAVMGTGCGGGHYKDDLGKDGNKIPLYDYKKCIRCYCCQEMCPEKAISVKTPWLAKLLDRNWRV